MYELKNIEWEFEWCHPISGRGGEEISYDHIRSKRVPQLLLHVLYVGPKNIPPLPWRDENLESIRNWEERGVEISHDFLSLAFGTREGGGYIITGLRNSAILHDTVSEGGDFRDLAAIPVMCLKFGNERVFHIRRTLFSFHIGAGDRFQPSQKEWWRNIPPPFLLHFAQGKSRGGTGRKDTKKTLFSRSLVTLFFPRVQIRVFLHQCHLWRKEYFPSPPSSFEAK